MSRTSEVLNLRIMDESQKQSSVGSIKDYDFLLDKQWHWFEIFRVVIDLLHCKHEYWSPDTLPADLTQQPLHDS